MTEQDCVANGGHCFDATGEMLDTVPPSFPEVCRHCRKKRIGTPQPPMSYADAPEQGIDKA